MVVRALKIWSLSLKPLEARRSALAWVIALVSAALMALTGVGNELEQRLQNVRADLLERPASGKIVIVEIDGKSLQALDSWPWPRSYYADAVDKLSHAGVSQIAFDVDFSSESSREHDERFAAAIANSAANVILPTFRQVRSPVQRDYVENRPIEMLRQHAFIASVNIHPDGNGQLSRYSFGTRTGGLARPSVASMLAERSGTIERTFAIDQSIDPASIPRLSFSDLLAAGPPPTGLAGKKVLIGATAIELGDRYSLRRFSVTPGVVIQALAAETLIQNADIPHLSSFLPLVIAFGSMWLLVQFAHLSRRKWGVAVGAAGTGIALFGSVLVLEYYLVATFAGVPAFFFLLSFAGLHKFSSTVGELETSQMSHEASGLPNEVAMQEFIARHGPGNIVAARMADFTDLLVLTDRAARRDLFGNLRARLSFLAEDEQIFHLDANTVGWLIKEDYSDDIPGHFETAMALFQAPFMAGTQRVKIGATFGISNRSVDQAKVAAQQARAQDRKWCRDDAEAASAIGLKQILLVDLEEAIRNDHLHVLYQPKWNLHTDRLQGFEALIRWEHPVYGGIGPDVFIPVIEKSGRIDSLTLFVIRRTLSDLGRWDRARPGLGCAVNISARLLGDSAFVQQAIALVEQSEVPNQQIPFEVTETAALDDPELSTLALGKIRDTGIKISIDDYGTGQSTMSYLQRLPVDEIKIDQSFVKTVITNRGNRVMVESTIEMAHALGLTVVAEGIEDAECMRLLHTLRCDIAQGWHISKPVSAEIIAVRWIAEGDEHARLMA